MRVVLGSCLLSLVVSVTASAQSSDTDRSSSERRWRPTAPARRALSVPADGDVRAATRAEDRGTRAERSDTRRVPTRRPGARAGGVSDRRLHGSEADPCIEAGALYASTFNRLWSIDPITLEASSLGPLPGDSFDIAIADTGVLHAAGSGGGLLWEVDACDFLFTALGTLPSSPNSLGPDVGGNLLGAGSAGLVTITPEPFGTTAPLPTVGWCGQPSGDVARNPCDGRLHVTFIECGLCPGGDALAELDPLTGTASNLVCLTTSSGAPLPEVFGLVWDENGTLWGGQSVSGRLLRIDPATGVAEVLTVTGGLPGVTGLAYLPAEGGCCPFELDFSELASGDTATGEPWPGVTVGGSAEVVAVDTGSPTCDDEDLLTPGVGPGNTEARGIALVLQEESSSCRPDDERDGGLITFDFADPVEIGWLGLLDIDEPGGTVTVVDSEGSTELPIPAQDDNGWQRLDVARDGVVRLELRLVGSGGLTEIRCAP
ncbi:MAG: hypothetical protein AAF533_26825 [Acidobacteriota bacterium]